MYRMQFNHWHCGAAMITGSCHELRINPRQFGINRLRLVSGFGNLVSGGIYCSEPSALLLPRVLEDAIQIGFGRDKQLMSRFLDALASRLKPAPCKQWMEIRLAHGESSTKRELQHVLHTHLPNTQVVIP